MHINVYFYIIGGYISNHLMTAPPAMSPYYENSLHFWDVSGKVCFKSPTLILVMKYLHVRLSSCCKKKSYLIMIRHTVNIILEYNVRI